MPTISDRVDVEVEVDVWCATCGEGLCNQSDFYPTGRRGLHVEPCRRCLEAAREEGERAGIEVGTRESGA